MTGLPDKAHGQCPKCHAPILYVVTSRKSKGVPVEIAVDVEPDPGTGGTVPLYAMGDVLYGNPVPKSKAAAMRAAGRPLHTEHAATCQKRGTSHRTS